MIRATGSQYYGVYDTQEGDDIPGTGCYDKRGIFVDVRTREFRSGLD